MEKQFVNYEIALKLKQLGFDEGCIALFDRNGEISGVEYINIIHLNGIRQKDLTYNYPTLAPLYQQAIDWFREEHKLQITIYYCGDKYPTVEEDYDAYCFTINEDCGFIVDTYEEAREAAILKAINIIENGTN